ncbi:MAG: zinc ribbon domain-containing protein [Methanobrevibacter sp.]|nr:zinc ribbon domain-containing protein [Methanobrevibacter sp.]
MAFWNYCPECGKRLAPNDEHCSNCGAKTIFEISDDNYIFSPPIHNVGFFNFNIDFSPTINIDSDFKYDICSCGYLNEIDNVFCHHCRAERIKKGVRRFINRSKKPKFDINDFITEDIICECGAYNSPDSEFCDMCGRKLHEDEKENVFDLNFHMEYDRPVFCSCGSENDENSLFCEKCGLPLDSYANIDGMKKLCVCSALNDIMSDFCVECGNDLNIEITEIICVCGARNPIGEKICSSCGKRLNPERTIKSKIVCGCGKIVDFDCEFCPNCGKNIKKTIYRKKSFSNTINSVKNFLNGV